MRVGFDARLWHHTGIGRYIRNLLPRLAESVQVVAWAAPDDVEAVRSALPTAEVRVCGAKPFSVREQIFWARALRGERLDLFHAPHLNAPLACPVPLVVTIHDLIPLRFPGTINSKLGEIYFQGMSRLVSGRAERIITDSENTKADLVSLLGVPEGKIRSIPLAADTRFAVPATADRRRAVRERFGLTGPYLLYSGQWKPYKNLGVLLQAFATLRPRRPSLKLVLIGREDPTQAHVPDLIAELGITGAVIPTGYIADEDDLVALYQEAAVFVFPSRYEGFGLPPLEAMAAGVPVVSSDAASLPEAVGDAGLLVSPEAPGPWVEAIGRVLDDAELHAELVQAGITRALAMTWEETARRTLEAYRGGAAGPLAGL